MQENASFLQTLCIFMLGNAFFLSGKCIFLLQEQTYFGKANSCSTGPSKGLRIVYHLLLVMILDAQILEPLLLEQPLVQ